jgi:hypothetical protein
MKQVARGGTGAAEIGAKYDTHPATAMTEFGPGVTNIVFTKDKKKDGKRRAAINKEVCRAGPEQAKKLYGATSVKNAVRSKLPEVMKWVADTVAKKGAAGAAASWGKVSTTALLRGCTHAPLHCTRERTALVHQGPLSSLLDLGSEVAEEKMEDVVKEHGAAETAASCGKVITHAAALMHYCTALVHCYYTAPMHTALAHAHAHAPLHCAHAPLALPLMPCAVCSPCTLCSFIRVHSTRPWPLGQRSQLVRVARLLRREATAKLGALLEHDQLRSYSREAASWKE